MIGSTQCERLLQVHPFQSAPYGQTPTASRIFSDCVPIASAPPKGGDTHGSKQRELDAGAQASLRLMQEESRAEVEEALIRVEAVAAAGLSRTEKMQTSVNEMM